MRRKPHYVFDTNVIVSAFLFDQSTPGRALSAALERGVVLLSAEVASELGAVLRRPKFDAYVRRERREEFLRGLIRETLLIEPTEPLRVCRDPSDDKFLELALSGAAACVVSGDADLLALHPFRRIPILSPSAFLKWLEA